MQLPNEAGATHCVKKGNKLISTGITISSPRFLRRPTAFFSTCWSRGTSESSAYGKQPICRCNSASTHFHVSWISDFIFYPKPLYKSLCQSFFYSFITILPSESGVTLDFPLDPMISLFHIHFGTCVTWLWENYDYRNVSWEMICI